MTVPSSSPARGGVVGSRSSSSPPKTGTWEAMTSLPSTVRVPAQLPPLATRGSPSGSGRSSSEGSVETRTSRFGSAKVTEVTPAWATRLWPRVASPVRRLGRREVGAHERVGRELLGERGDPAALGALEGRGRLGEGDRGDGDEDDDDDRQLEGEELPARVARRRLSVTTMYSTSTADRSATTPHRSHHDHRVPLHHRKGISTMRLHRIALGALVAASLALTGCGATKEQVRGRTPPPPPAAPRRPACSTWSRTARAAGTTRPPAPRPR